MRTPTRHCPRCLRPRRAGLWHLGVPRSELDARGVVRNRQRRDCRRQRRRGRGALHGRAADSDHLAGASLRIYPLAKHWRNAHLAVTLALVILPVMGSLRVMMVSIVVFLPVQLFFVVGALAIWIASPRTRPDTPSEAAS